MTTEEFINLERDRLATSAAICVVNAAVGGLRVEPETLDLSWETLIDAMSLGVKVTVDEVTKPCQN